MTMVPTLSNFHRKHLAGDAMNFVGILAVLGASAASAVYGTLSVIGNDSPSLASFIGGVIVTVIIGIGNWWASRRHVDKKTSEIAQKAETAEISADQAAQQVIQIRGTDLNTLKDTIISLQQTVISVTNARSATEEQHRKALAQIEVLTKQNQEQAAEMKSMSDRLALFESKAS
jgi:hypothetical protein